MKASNRFPWMVISLMLSALPVGSAGSTGHIPVVSDFNLSRYTGVWYEIIRSDNSFERNLTHVTATYTVTGKKSLSVRNRGFNPMTGKWVESTARGKFDPESDRGEFSVSFFWPFTARYRVIELGADYEYAVVTSNSISYFWILNRKPQMAKELLEAILIRAREWGFDTSGFIRVDQTSGRHDVSPADPQNG